MSHDQYPALAPAPERQEQEIPADFWSKFRRFARRLPFAEDLLTAYYTATDRQTPRAVRATLIAALAYFVLPTDAIPDVLVGMGFTDDAAVLAAAIRTVAAHIRPAHRERARQTLHRGDY